MKIICLRALLLSGWLGIIGAGGGMLQAQESYIEGPVTADQVVLWHDGDIEWVAEGDVYKLRATTQTPVAGKAEIRIPRVEQYAFVYYRLQGTNMKAFTSPYTGDPARQESKNESKYSTTGGVEWGCTIELTLSSEYQGEFPEVTVSNLVVARNLGKFPWRNPRMDIGSFYDVDGDGVMESVAPIFGQLFLNHITGRYLYAKENMGEEGIDQQILNVDNDGVPGLLVRAYEDSRLRRGAFDGTGADADITFNTGSVRDLLPCDYNNDGRTDFLLPDGRVYEQLWDGSFSFVTLTKMTENEYNQLASAGGGNFWQAESGSSVSKLVSAIPGGRLNLSGASMPPKLTTVAYSDLSDMRMSDIDFDGDGRPDMINYGTGELWTNLGDNRYVVSPMGGMLYFRDLNGDQLPDYIHYNPDEKTVTANVVDAAGKMNTQTLNNNMSMDNRVWCYDFDNDGDVDILLPFSYFETTGGAFLLLFVNDGKGHFTTYERGFTEPLFFVACADVDNDGKYEVVGGSSDGFATPVVTELFTWKVEPATFDNVEGKSWMTLEGQLVWRNGLQPADIKVDVADVNGDGVYEVLTNDEYSRVIPQTGITPNEPPARMEKPSFIFEASTGYLKVSWEPGSDALTPSADLTYALRIGTEPGKGDVYYAHAGADGRRRNLADGNMGHNLSKLLNAFGWKTGAYYIAVQAIDAMHRGGEWSEEAVFEHRAFSAAFTVSATEAATTDTVTVSCMHACEAGFRYVRDFDGAEICSANTDSSVFRLRWAVPGEKTLSLQVTDDAGNVSPVESRSLHIFANRFSPGDISYSPAGLSVAAMMDIDNDGTAEALTSNGVYVNDGKGHFTKLNKVFNTNLKFTKNGGAGEIVVAVDWNADGIADIVNISPSTSSRQIVMNSGNKSMSVTAAPEQLPEWVTGCFDLDNDGFADFSTIIAKGGIFHNTGDNVNFEQVPLDGLTDDFHVVDMNNDGWLDIFYQSYNSDLRKSEFVCFVNRGDLNFEKEIVSAMVTDRTSRPVEIIGIADFNSDGYLDILVRNSPDIGESYSFMLLLNDRSGNFDDAVEISLPNKGSEQEFPITDLDNNGYPDILTGRHVLYFYPELQTRLWAHDPYEELEYESEVLDAGRPYTMADINGDGVPDAPQMFNLSQIKNTPPEAPANVQAVQTDKGFVLEWDPARDAETPFAQMRYNVSVKKKGASGEGAFVVSPLNGLTNTGWANPCANYRRGTRMEMPLSALAPGEYEIQVQAVDLWSATSPVSQAFVLNVQSSAVIGLPESVCAGSPAMIVSKGNGTTIEWDWDGGRVIAQEGNVYEVEWDEAGYRVITLNVDGVVSSATVCVRPAIDAAFTLPEAVVSGAENVIVLPEVALIPGTTLEWSAAKGDDNFTALCDLEAKYSWMCGNMRKDISISHNGAGREEKIVFSGEGEYVLRLSVTTGCGSAVYEQPVSVGAPLPVPQIRLVTVDAASGKNLIAWNLPGDLPAGEPEVCIYKEGSRYNDFRLLDKVPVSQLEYTDVTSNPDVTTSRYRLTLANGRGAESTPGVIHRSVHVMINKGAGKSWNIMWTPYEGAVLESFRVLRGASPDDMAVVATVAGNAVSWTDVLPPDGELYYALEYDTPYNETWQPVSASVPATRAAVPLSARAVAPQGRSNVARVSDASEVTFAEQITIRSLEAETALTPEQRQLHLFADVSPLTATYRSVSWQITEGAGLAEIDAQGLLVAKSTQGGQVVVKALAYDGSGISATIVIPVTETRVVIEEVTSVNVSTTGGRNGEISVTALGGIQPLQYSINDGVDFTELSHFTGLPAGQYRILVKDAEGNTEAYTGNPVVLTEPGSQEELAVAQCSTVNVSVYGGSDGEIIITATGGQAPLQFSVDNGATYRTSWIFTGLSAGTYQVAVKDADGRVAYYAGNPVVLTQPEQPEETVYALEIEDFRLQGGAAVTGSRTVTLEQHVVGGVPRYYQVCEDTLNAGDTWIAYQLLPMYELSAGTGTKTVYMRVKGESGESHWAAASIRYEEAAGLRIEQLLVNDGADYVAEPQIRLTLIVTGDAQEMQVELNAWNSGWTPWQQNGVYTLTEGEGDYVCRVKVRNAQGESEEATVSFVYKQAPRKLSVEDFALQGGSSFTLSRTITLDHWVDGGMPLAYAASEYPDLRDARWLRYEEQPEYTLRGMTGMKTVYFAVASGKDTSEIVSARILLDEESASGLNVRVWPNPVNDVLHIMLTDEDAEEETRVIVRTAMGQLVEQRTCHGREISLEVSRYPFGILFVELTNNGRKTVKQILKK